MDEKIIKRNTVQVNIDEDGRLGSEFIQAVRSRPEVVGSNLITAALEQNEKKFSAKVLEQVTGLIEHRNNLYIALEKTQKEIQKFDRRIAAIDAGEFQVGWNGVILYNDVTLN